MRCPDERLIGADRYAHAMTDPDAVMDAIVVELEAAGPVTVEARPNGGEACVRSPQGEQLARQMVMSSEDDAAALLDADLG